MKNHASHIIVYSKKRTLSSFRAVNVGHFKQKIEHLQLKKKYKISIKKITNISTRLAKKT